MPSISSHRWCAKKVARSAFGALPAVPRRLLAARGSRTNAVRVLTYHCFGSARRDPFRLDPPSFERQMRWLARHGLAISLADLRDYLNGERVLRDGSVLVTIDDGDAGIAEHAWPRLRHYGIPAVAFIIAGQLGEDGRLARSQVRRLADQGLEIGSHSLTHASMARIPRGEAQNEALESRRALEAVVGRPVTSFAYPYGTLADFDDETGEILAACGYDCAFTSQHGVVRAGMARFTLPRVKIEAGDPDWLFPRACRGSLDRWSLVDRLLWRAQRPFDVDLAG
jgi:peptidoglycan/xylan/chitin deacetylase (PgdA/CDA1 family)